MGCRIWLLLSLSFSISKLIIKDLLILIKRVNKKERMTVVHHSEVLSIGESVIDPNGIARKIKIWPQW